MKETENQQENIKKLIRLTQENPGLKIIPMVDINVCQSDEFSYWAGNWGEAQIDDYWISDEHIYFKSNDYESLIEDCMDSLVYDPEMDSKSDKELEKIAKERVDNASH